MNHLQLIPPEILAYILNYGNFTEFINLQMVSQHFYKIFWDYMINYEFTPISNARFKKINLKMNRTRIKRLNISNLKVSSFGNLNSLSLTYLNLSSKINHGSLSTIAQRFPNLKHLIFENNRWIKNSNIPSLCNLQFLETLSLTGCFGLNDYCIKHISKLTNLKHLSLSISQGLMLPLDIGSGVNVNDPIFRSELRRKLEKSDFIHISALTNLESLDCGNFYAPAITDINAVSKLPKLRKLYFHQCQLIDMECLEIIANMSCLQELFLRICAFDISSFQCLIKLRNLRLLDMKRSKINQNDLDAFQKIPHLKLILQ